MSLILGIDPGSIKTGYGIISDVSGKHTYISSGVIRIPNDVALPDKLKVIFDSVSQLIEKYMPDEFAIESVFMAKSAGSALKLGQARGAAIVAAVNHDLNVSEYEAKKVKQAVVGNGGADKSQVQHMVKTMLNLPGNPAEDAADALAVAICHANTQTSLIQTASAKKFRRGRLI